MAVGIRQEARAVTASAPVRQPVLFVSHGAPNLVLHRTPAHDFLGRLAADLPRPDAIVVISAHFMTHEPAVTLDERPATIHDFGGFEPELHAMTYPAPGNPALAREIVERLAAAGMPAHARPNHGFDHGTWVPLKLIYPQADIPVVQVAVQPRRDATYHMRLGSALAPLRERNILIVGSGAATHNLHELFGNGYEMGDPVPDWVRTFGDWLAARVQEGDGEALLAWQDAPYGARNHPTPEHILPLHAAFGAAGGSAMNRVPGRRVHTSEQYGVLMMDVYRFD
jgi:4,5-DOPA dioxygenase extradiol